MSEPKEVKIDQPNEAGFAIIRVRENGDYKEGVVDANGSEVLQLSSRLFGPRPQREPGTRGDGQTSFCLCL